MALSSSFRKLQVHEKKTDQEKKKQQTRKKTCLCWYNLFGNLTLHSAPTKHQWDWQHSPTKLLWCSTGIQVHALRIWVTSQLKMLQSQLQTLKSPSMIQSKETMKRLCCAQTHLTWSLGPPPAGLGLTPSLALQCHFCPVYSRSRGAPVPLSESQQAAHSPILVVIQVPQVAAHFHVPLKHNTNPTLPPRTSAGPGPAARRHGSRLGRPARIPGPQRPTPPDSRPAWPASGGRSWSDRGAAGRGTASARAWARPIPHTTPPSPPAFPRAHRGLLGEHLLHHDVHQPLPLLMIAPLLLQDRLHPPASRPEIDASYFR